MAECPYICICRITNFKSFKFAITRGYCDATRRLMEKFDPLRNKCTHSGGDAKRPPPPPKSTAHSAVLLNDYWALFFCCPEFQFQANYWINSWKRCNRGGQEVQRRVCSSDEELSSRAMNRSLTRDTSAVRERATPFNLAGSINNVWCTWGLNKKKSSDVSIHYEKTNHWLKTTDTCNPCGPLYLFFLTEV